MKKRIVSAVLALIFVLALLPGGIFAAETGVDGFTAIKGTITKQDDGTYAVTKALGVDSIIQKEGQLSEGWIRLDMPVGSFCQISRESGIVFGATDMSDLSKGTYYFAYRVAANNSAAPAIRLEKVVNGKATSLGSIAANAFIAPLERQGIESIELAVRYTDDGYIGVYINGSLAISASAGGAISGKEYGIMIQRHDFTDANDAPQNTDASNDFIFNSLTVEGSNKYKTVQGGINMAKGGIQSTANNTLWLLDDTHSSETVIRFSIDNYASENDADNSDNNNYSGVVFGVRESAGNNKLEGAGISYYFLYVNYDKKNPQYTNIGLTRSDALGINKAWDRLVDKRITSAGGYADGNDTDEIADAVQANDVDFEA